MLQNQRSLLRFDVDKLIQSIQPSLDPKPFGKIFSATGPLLSCSLPGAIGDLCEIKTQSKSILGEIIGFKNNIAYLVPFEPSEEICPNLPVFRKGHGLKVPVGESLLGRILDGLGRPIDNQGPLHPGEHRTVAVTAPPAMIREDISEIFHTGVRAIDGLLTLGKGQRVGIFAGAGVGKSTLLGEIAKNSSADVNVIALIGERGREVRPFLEKCIGEEGMKKSIVLIATCDQTPLMRVRAGQVAITMANYFREQGKHVLFMLDSLTRMAGAQRELGLALGESPTTRGYPTSVFQLLANTVEQLGNSDKGSITGLLTVLVDGGDFDEPISDSVRSFVDGHILLDRKLVANNHYPAISVPMSVSRVATEIQESGHRHWARRIVAAYTAYLEMETAIKLGAYQKGAHSATDLAIQLLPDILKFLRQDIGKPTKLEETKKMMQQIAEKWIY